ncbi:MAG: hypothetical protein PHW76_07845 [Alphaproteobacteria bacterium]|nr:hypothetical protein [Alphaproteobacteria bacterium]
MNPEQTVSEKQITSEFKASKTETLKRIAEVAVPLAVFVGGIYLGVKSNLWYMYNHDMPIELAKVSSNTSASWFVSHPDFMRLKYAAEGVVGGAMLGGYGAVASHKLMKRISKLHLFDNSPK